jgi:hypothetical protein
MDNSGERAILDARIAAIRENISELVEEATGYSGAADENLSSARIEEEQAVLDRLLQRTSELDRR